MKLEITEKKKAKIITATGRLDTNTSPDLEKYLTDNLTGKEKKIVFDLSGLEFISSAGLRVIVATQQSVPDFWLVVSKKDPETDPVYDVLDMSGMAMMLNIAEDISETLK